MHCATVSNVSPSAVHLIDLPAHTPPPGASRLVLLLPRLTLHFVSNGLLLVKEIPLTVNLGIQVSADWYVLCEFPWKFELTALVLGTMRYVGTGGHFLAFPDAFVWRPEQGAVFTLVHRHNGRTVRVKAPAFFAYHHVNCVDNSDGTVSVDMMC